jgi:hypothetical protein
MIRRLALNQVWRPASMSIDLSLLLATAAMIRLAEAASTLLSTRILGKRPGIVTKPPYVFVAS